MATMFMWCTVGKVSNRAALWVLSEEVGVEAEGGRRRGPPREDVG